MHDADKARPKPQLVFRHPRGFAVVLGTNEIASATAVSLHRAGWGVVLCHDKAPVIRRRMAFYDAVFGDETDVDGIKGRYMDQTSLMRDAICVPGEVVVTRRDFSDVLVIQRIDVLVDARMQKYETKPDLRWLAGVSLGLGPGFTAGSNCDIAVETHPSAAGSILIAGETRDPDRQPVVLGNKGKERFIYTVAPGRWHTALEIGAYVYKNLVIGYLEGRVVRSPFDGTVRGLARDGLQIPGGAKIVEIDPRKRLAQWSGVDVRGLAIANGVTRAVHSFVQQFDRERSDP